MAKVQFSGKYDGLERAERTTLGVSSRGEEQCGIGTDVLLRNILKYAIINF